MKNLSRVFSSVFFVVLISACASESATSNDDKFEEFYSALGMDDFIAPSSPAELNVSDLLGEDSVTVFVPEEGAEQESSSSVNLVGTESNAIMLNIPMDHIGAKRIFREKILESLTPEEIEQGTEFYSSKAGLKIHRAIIDAENAVNDYINGK